MVAWVRKNWLPVLLGITCLVLAGWTLLGLIDLLDVLKVMGN